MKIIIPNNDQPLQEIEFDDDGFDVPGWVSITIGDVIAEVHVSQLYPAVLAFKERYNEEKSR